VEKVEDLGGLVRAALSGDMRAFDALMRETTGSIRTIVIDGVPNRADVDDLVQEVFLRALRNLASLQDPDRFRPWIYAIARNAVLDHRRAARRRPTDALEDTDVPDVDVTTEDLVELRELAASVRISVGRLAPLDAALLAMVSLMGFTPTEIAGALGMTPTAAKVAVHRARARLRQSMLLQEAAGEPKASCENFRALIDAGDLVPAAVHARGCPVCSGRRSARSVAPAG